MEWSGLPGPQINREVFWNNLWKIWTKWLLRPNSRYELAQWSRYLDKHLSFIHDTMGLISQEESDNYYYLCHIAARMKHQLRLMA